MSIVTEEKLLDRLPHGRGIDCDWEITFHKNGNITCKNFFHAMTEHGYYDGYMPFTVKIFVTDGYIDCKVTCNENRRPSFYGLKEYLNELIYFSLPAGPIREV